MVPSSANTELGEELATSAKEGVTRLFAAGAEPVEVPELRELEGLGERDREERGDRFPFRAVREGEAGVARESERRPLPLAEVRGAEWPRPLDEVREGDPLLRLALPLRGRPDDADEPTEWAEREGEAVRSRLAAGRREPLRTTVAQSEEPSP